MNDIPLELKKEFNLEDSEDEKKIDFEKIIIDNKTIIYSTVLYSCALVIGSVIYRLLQSNSFDKLFQSKNTTVSQLFCENICNYMSLFLITVFLAFCLIGYGIVNIIPFILGLQTGISTAYYYMNFQTKGVGYAIILIAPFSALFLTILMFTIKTSSNVSKEIVSITKKESVSKIDFKPSIKEFLIYGLAIIICSGVSAVLETLLKSIITI